MIKRIRLAQIGLAVWIIESIHISISISKFPVSLRLELESSICALHSLAIWAPNWPCHVILNLFIKNLETLLHPVLRCLLLALHHSIPGLETFHAFLLVILAILEGQGAHRFSFRLESTMVCCRVHDHGSLHDSLHIHLCLHGLLAFESLVLDLWNLVESRLVLIRFMLSQMRR